MEWIKNALYKVGCWFIGSIAIIVICVAMIIGLAVLSALAPIICLVTGTEPLKSIVTKKDNSQLITD